MIFLIIPVLLSLGILLFLRQKVLTHRPASYPYAETVGGAAPGKKRVVCFGDSNTHGVVSFDWVKVLEEQLAGFEVFNAGINSDLTFSLLRRVKDVIAARPDFITVLIGTNDVNAASYDYAERHYRSKKRLIAGEVPDISSFEKNYNQLIRILSEETGAKIALMSLPLMGEDLNNRTNSMADEYSELIREIAVSNHLVYLPVREQQKAWLGQHPSRAKYPFEKYSFLLLRSVLLRYLLGRTWNSISAGVGNELSPDFMHQNETAGQMILDQVKKWIEDESSGK